MFRSIGTLKHRLLTTGHPQFEGAPDHSVEQEEIENKVRTDPGPSHLSVGSELCAWRNTPFESEHTTLTTKLRFRTRHSLSIGLELTYLGPHFPMLRQPSFPSPTIAALHVSANREEIDACAKSCASNFDAQLMRASCMHT